MRAPPHGVARNGALRAYMDVALDCVILADASGFVVELTPAVELTLGQVSAESVLIGARCAT